MADWQNELVLLSIIVVYAVVVYPFVRRMVRRVFLAGKDLDVSQRQMLFVFEGLILALALNIDSFSAWLGVGVVFGLTLVWLRVWSWWEKRQK